MDANEVEEDNLGKLPTFDPYEERNAVHALVLAAANGPLAIKLPY